jgi:signal transduction histidine kinase/ligand-binding sensor domain-containing protein/CheY-like chemotaxis protein
MGQTVGVGKTVGSARFDHLTAADGLSHTTVWDIHQDSRGFFWFATQDGLNRYDGYEFRVYRHDSANQHSIGNSEIVDILEDRYGDLWLQTRNQGLERYVRNQGIFEHYRHGPENSRTLWSDDVWTCFEDSAGELWVGTSAGLNRFDRPSGVFLRIGEDPEDPMRSRLVNVYSQQEDSAGALWVGTDEGVARYQPANDNLTVFRHDPTDPGSLSHDEVNSVYVDSRDQVWVGTPLGLNRFDPEGGGFFRYQHQAERPGSLSHNQVLDPIGIIENQAGDLFVLTDGGVDLFEPRNEEFVALYKPQGSRFKATDVLVDGHGDLWIAAGVSGVLRIQQGGEKPVLYRNDPRDFHSLSSNSPRSLYEDSRGAVWIGGYSGVDRFDRRREQFVTYSSQSKEGKLSSDNIWAVYEDLAETLWVGTYDEGLNRLDRAAGTTAHFAANPRLPGGLPSGVVMAFLEDSAGDFWVGTGDGLARLDRLSGQFHTLHHDPDDPHSLSEESIYVLLEDSQGRFWVGTGNGVDRLNRATDRFQHYQHDAEDRTSLEEGNIYSLLEDHSGVVWVGMMDSGISRYDEERDRFVRFHPNFEPAEEAELPGIAVFHEDKEGQLWVGTYGIGLLRLGVDRSQVRRFQEADGLPSSTVLGILEDDSGYLWLSTNRGICRFDPRTDTFRNYGVADGLQGEVFSSGSFFRSSRGEMFFGGVSGLSSFFPDQIEHDPEPPVVAITEFRLFDEPALLKRNDPDSPLEQPITETQELTLDHRQYVFSLEFAALHFANPKENRYAYRLEGFDRDWIEVDAGRRVVRYSNLAAGDYVFRVKASNPHGVWNEEGKAIRITVLPPPWKTWWAYTIYGLILVAGIVAYVQVQTRKLLRERALNQRLRQADQLKDEFLANTSHELRTPLYGITGLAESLLDGARGDLPATAREDLDMIVSSGRRLGSLVDDILDFSKLSKEHLELHTRAVDLHALCDLVLRLSRPLVGPKELRLINSIRPGLPAVQVDENRLQQVFHNLVGNAIKFTDHGRVEVSAVVDGDLVEVRVEDTGVGIAADQQQKIFEAFQQADASSERSHGGTGLGLAVTRQLIALHGGSLWVESEPGKGAVFAFTLPVSSQPLPNVRPLMEAQLRRIADAETEEAVLSSAEEVEVVQTHEGALEGAKILIVDDEPVIRRVLSNHLAHRGYRLAQVSGGEEALEQIQKDGPFDLILLDVMMPHMSGYETCRRLRLEYSPQQLPVVFLSAKSQINDLVEGLKAGGNDYLTKPIGKRELLARVETHLELLRMHRHVEELVEQRTAEIKIIRGLLPICSGCKKVRDDTGYWNGLEEYICEHTEAEFSHGLCPACAHQLYPGVLEAENLE